MQVIATPVSPDVTLREADLVEISMGKRVHQQGYWLPVSALTENARGVWSCLVVEPLQSLSDMHSATHKLKRRDIEIIALEDERVYVSGNIDNGDLILTSGMHRVVPNQRVQLAADHGLETMSIAQNR